MSFQSCRVTVNSRTLPEALSLRQALQEGKFICCAAFLSATFKLALKAFADSHTQMALAKKALKGAQIRILFPIYIHTTYICISLCI